jgi:THO complex subunit 4
MVADKVDMSLDDIIASNKKSGRGGNSSGRGRGNSSIRRGGARGTTNFSGPQRRGREGRGGLSRGNRTPYTRPSSNNTDRWEHDMYDKPTGNASGSTRLSGRRSGDGLRTGGHLQISNLEFNVSEADIKELFSEFGKLKKATINYDGSGRSHGTADVVFERQADANKAFTTYNGVPLDGRPMKIESVSSAIVSNKPLSTRLDNSFRGKSRQPTSRAFSNATSRDGGSSRGGRGRGGNQRGGRGGGRGGGNKKAPVSKEDLDKELDSYIESADS